jgi:hypothetical protein
LAKFSLGLARRADELADKIFHTDMSSKKMPERKTLGYSAMQTLAAENRKRAIDLTLAKERMAVGAGSAPSPRDIVKPR